MVKENINKHYKGILLGFIACFFYALMDALAKYSLSILHIPFTLYYFGTNITALVIIIPYIIYKLYCFKLNILELKNKWIIIVAILSMLSFGSAFLGLSLISLDIFYSILFITPIITSIVGILILKESLTIKKIIALTLGFIGIIFITNPFAIKTHDIKITGLILAFLVTILDSAIAICSRRFLHSEHPVTVRSYLFILASFFSGGFIISSGSYVDYNFSVGDILITSLTSISMLTASLCYTKAYQSTPSSLVANTYYSFIIWGVLFGYLIFNELPSIYTITGCGIIIIANVYLYFDKKAS